MSILSRRIFRIAVVVFALGLIYFLFVQYQRYLSWGPVRVFEGQLKAGQSQRDVREKAAQFGFREKIVAERMRSQPNTLVFGVSTWSRFPCGGTIDEVLTFSGDSLRSWEPLEETSACL